MEKANMNWTAKTLVRHMQKGAVNFDNAIQRSFVWDLKKKSLLIHSMIYGYAIPAMYFTRENGVYNSLDGKQRSSTIFSFMEDGFALGKDTPSVRDDEGEMYEIGGKTFSQLPEWMQDKIRDYNLTIYYYQDMTDDEAREFFKRLNNGKHLSSIELTRVQTKCLDEFQRLAKHEAIQSVVSESGKRRFIDEMIAMQLYHFVKDERPDFTTKHFREWANNEVVDRTTIENIEHGLDALKSFMDQIPDDDQRLIKTIKTRTHFISCAYYCTMALLKGLDQDTINTTLTHFFSGDPSISGEYNESVTAGSAKATALETRRKVMNDLLQN